MKVWGLVYSLTEAQLAILEKSEGTASNPPHYTRKMASVTLQKTKEVVQVCTYVAHPSRICKEFVAPSSHYLSIVAEGALEAGLPTDYVVQILQAARKPKIEDEKGK